MTIAPPHVAAAVAAALLFIPAARSQDWDHNPPAFLTPLVFASFETTTGWPSTGNAYYSTTSTAPWYAAWANASPTPVWTCGTTALSGAPFLTIARWFAPGSY